MQCSQKCADLYIGGIEQQLHKRMAQYRRATSSGQDSAVHLHLKEKRNSFEDSNVHILDREDRWFETGVKEAINVKLEKTYLNGGGGLWYHLPSTYSAALSLLPKQFHIHTLDSVTKTCPFRQVDNLTTCTLVRGF